MRHKRRRLAALALALGVTALQLWLFTAALDSQLGRGAADGRPRRIEVAFVRVLKPSAPAVVMPALMHLPPPPVLRAPQPPAALPMPLLPEAAASAPEAPPDVERPAAEPVLAQASAPSAEVPAAPASAASAAAPAFEWPPSTRLSYSLSGYYRGEIAGSAQVEWLRRGTHYQVNLDVTIGAPFAPLITRQMRSDGELGPEGLRPRRYDEQTWILFRGTREATIRFEPDAVRLPGGRRAPRLAGVQDAVSQFVQLSWLFTLQPERLTAGRQVTVPLALPRQVDFWTYDVREAETLVTPAGPVQAVRLQPRRQARPGGDLVPEMWFAPTLQYLPVRILIRQDADNVVDLLIKQLPEQAADEAAPATDPGPDPGQSRSWPPATRY